MSNLIGRIGALAAGALAMYYLDPQFGAERRAALADLVASGLRGRPPQLDSRALPVKRRAYHRPAKSDPQADAELRDRIRDRLGRLVSHPRAIHVSVKDGVARLSGDVLVKERDGLLLQLQDMPGVQRLVNAMTAHESPTGIASLEQREESGAARTTAA